MSYKAGEKDNGTNLATGLGVAKQWLLADVPPPNFETDPVCPRLKTNLRSSANQSNHWYLY
jgi:hypothetical protein